MAIDRQVDEGNAALTPGELALTDQRLAVFDRHCAGQIDSWYHQGSSKVAAISPQAAPHILPAEGGTHGKSHQLPLWIRAEGCVGRRSRGQGAGARQAG